MNEAKTTTTLLQSESAGSRIEINGRAPRIEELACLAQVNYGHFTSMQVRDRSARGLSLHLQRIAKATRDLFGSELDIEQVRRWMRQILDEAPASLRITVFSQSLDRSFLERPVPADVLIASSPARAARTEPLRLQSIRHERVLPHIKHVGTFGLFHEWRQARLAGFDDVVFTTADGEISEGSIWNIGFWDGQRVIWPSAPALPGITLQLLDSGLRVLGIETVIRPIFLDQMEGFRCAFTMNSGSVGPMVTSIDTQHFEVDGELKKLLAAAYESQSPELI